EEEPPNFQVQEVEEDSLRAGEAKTAPDQEDTKGLHHSGSVGEMVPILEAEPINLVPLSDERKMARPREEELPSSGGGDDPIPFLPAEAVGNIAEPPPRRRAPARKQPPPKTEALTPEEPSWSQAPPPVRKSGKTPHGSPPGKEPAQEVHWSAPPLAPTEDVAEPVPAKEPSDSGVAMGPPSAWEAPPVRRATTSAAVEPPA